MNSNPPVQSCLPQACFATPDETVLRAPAPQQTVEKESTPPIPPELVGRVCVYGYAVTDNIIEAYCAAHSPDDNRGKLYDDRVILRLAARCGLRVSIFRPYGPDNILWFSYSRGGPVQIKKIPIASRLQDFATELGIMETAKWHDLSRRARAPRRY
ncbi:hypothetical protein B0H13DRAFT_538704 [Mycena leptocephala]|nr:hypothetical protein B0H13DRAFT_538704 [Mycena leptocephala]